MAGAARSARDLRALLVEVVPVLVYYKMIMARAVKVCGVISDAFAAIARDRGFDAYLVSRPGHFVSEVVTTDGVFEVDLSHIQFSCSGRFEGSGMRDLLGRKTDGDADVRRALERVAENPFAAISVRRVSGLSQSATAPSPDVAAIGYTPVTSFSRWKRHADAVARGRWDAELDVSEMKIARGLPYASKVDARAALAALDDGAAGGSVLWKGAGLPRLQEDSAPWYHVTDARNLPYILAHGLRVKSPARLYDSGSARTYGGIYVASDPGDVTSFICSDVVRKHLGEWIADGKPLPSDGSLPFGMPTVAVLTLRIRRGTRFCLDEDDLTRLWHRVRSTSPRVFGPDTKKLVEEATAATRATPTKKSAIGAWSCRLAHHLDQGWLRGFYLRLFDAPEIVGVDRVTCRDPGLPVVAYLP